jgi:hypothetical protein
MENNGQILNPSGMTAQTVKTSGCAIASLVFSIAGFVVPLISSLLGLIFGIVGLVAVSKGGGQIKGKGMAIAGIVVSCVSLVWSVLVVLLLLYWLMLPVVISP